MCIVLLVASSLPSCTRSHPFFGVSLVSASRTLSSTCHKLDNTRSSHSLRSRARTPTNRFVTSAVSCCERHHAELLGNDFARCARGRGGALSRRPSWFVSHPSPQMLVTSVSGGKPCKRTHAHMHMHVLSHVHSPGLPARWLYLCVVMGLNHTTEQVALNAASLHD